MPKVPEAEREWRRQVVKGIHILRPTLTAAEVVDYLNRYKGDAAYFSPRQTSNVWGGDDPVNLQYAQDVIRTVEEARYTTAVRANGASVTDADPVPVPTDEELYNQRAAKVQELTSLQWAYAIRCGAAERGTWLFPEEVEHLVGLLDMAVGRYEDKTLTLLLDSYIGLLEG